MNPKGIPWYNHGMKTAISIPDELFASADELAARLGVSRSQLYATAVAEYLAKHRDQDVTARLNAAYADDDQPPDAFVQRASARTLARDEW